MRHEIRSILSLALPVVIAEGGWLAMQIVDIGMVGRLGPEAIGAVVAQAFGARRTMECEQWLKHGLLLAVLVTVPLTVASRAGLRFLDVWGFDPRVLEQTSAYLLIITWSMLPLLLYAALRRYLQAINIVRPIMVVLITANVINAVANWVLVFGNWGAPALGVAGAGWATCISRTYMVVVLGVVVFTRVTCPQRLWADDSRIEWDRMRRLLALGWPAAMQVTLEFGVFAAVTVLAGRLEPQTLAAHQIVANLAGLTFMVPLGISAAGAVRVGQAVGRCDAVGARRAGWLALGLGVTFMSVAAATFVTLPGPILRLFTADARVLETGVVLLLLAALFQLFDGVQVVATGVLRGLGDTRAAMLSNLAGHWVVGLPVGYALCFSWGMGVVGLWIGLSLGLILVGVVLISVWHRRVRELPHRLGDPASTAATV